MPWTWRLAIGLRHHEKMLFMRVVNGKLKDPRLKQNVCYDRKFLPSNLEMEATKKVWRFGVKLRELMWGSRVSAVTVQIEH